MLADGCDADASGFGEPADAPYWRSTGGTARDRYGDHEGDGLTLGLGIEFRVCRLGFPR